MTGDYLRRSRRTTTMMTIRMPTELPPMTRTLAKTGENRKCIAFLLF